MTPKNIQITTTDLMQLKELISASLSQPNAPSSSYLGVLNEELMRAQVVKPSEISEKIVTMNSRVRLTDLSNKEEITFALVFPRQGLGDDEISVLAPLGTALLGMAVGDEAEIRVPAGSLHLRVDEILYQPEKAERASTATGA